MMHIMLYVVVEDDYCDCSEWTRKEAMDDDKIHTPHIFIEAWQEEVVAGCSW